MDEAKKSAADREVEAIFQRLEVMKTNLGLWNEDIPRPSRRDLQSNHKKTSGFRKKVEALTTETLPQIIDDISKLNLSRYIEEAAIGLSQAKLERKADVLAAVKVASELHLRYEDFGQFLFDELQKRFKEVFVASSKTQLSSAEYKQRFARQKSLVLLIFELYMAGIIREPLILLSALNFIVHKNNQTTKQPNTNLKQYKQTSLKGIFTVLLIPR